MAIRLLRTDNIRLCSFADGAVPDYAILSHTWEDEELSFQEMVALENDHEHPASKKSGYRKIIETCRKANEAGIAYAWVDTCCIDKTSSSELSEAINSMYKWYERAKVCYVFLADLEAGDASIETTFPGCKWFTRGWCLQELLAPSVLLFFDKQWSYVGSKLALSSMISRITQIPELLLLNGGSIGLYTVAQKMSWAANRKTTRIEDVAYSLLGIFDVNMSMLYGEGSRAFLRLQEEIISRSHDRSIFAFPCKSSKQGPKEADESGIEYFSLLATSPKRFLGYSRSKNAISSADQGEAFALTNKGLYFRRVKLYVEPLRGLFSLPLDYTIASHSDNARMWLRKVGSGLFVRVGDISLDKNQDVRRTNESSYPVVEEGIYIINRLTLSIQFELHDASRYAIHVQSRDFSISRAVQAIQRAPSSDRWDASRMLFLTLGERPIRAHWKVFPHLARKNAGSDTSVTQISQTPFYLVAGLFDDIYSKPYKAWVRLYTSKEWRALEEAFGIITNLDDVACLQKNAGTSCRMETSYMAVTATIKQETKGNFSIFKLILNFDTEFGAIKSAREDHVQVVPNMRNDVMPHQDEPPVSPHTQWSTRRGFLKSSWWK